MSPKKPVVTAWVSSLRHIVWCRWQCITIGALWQSCLRRHKAQRPRELFFFLWEPGPNGMNIHEYQLFRCEQQGIPSYSIGSLTQHDPTPQLVVPLENHRTSELWPNPLKKVPFDHGWNSFAGSKVVLFEMPPWGCWDWPCFCWSDD